MSFFVPTKREVQLLCQAIDSLEICIGDIIQHPCDAIVCPDDTKLKGTGGLAKKIHHAAGPLLREATATLGECQVGKAITTDAFQLNAKHVIHTVSPAWNGGVDFEEKKLAECYASAMQEAVALGCRTVVFPSIGTGFHRFPKKRAAEIATKTLLYYLMHAAKPIRVAIVCANEETYEISKSAFKKRIVECFLDYYCPENCVWSNLSDGDMGPYFQWMLKLMNLETIEHKYNDYLEIIGVTGQDWPEQMNSDRQHYLLSQSAQHWDYRTCLAYIIYLQRKSHWDGYVNYEAPQCELGGVRNVLLRMKELLDLE